MTGVRPGGFELLSTLDERYLTSPAVWETLRPTASLVLSGPFPRTAAGVLDPAPILALAERLVSRFPRLRMRILPSLLGLHSPAWVLDPAFDVDRHVRIHPGRVAADAIPDALLAGHANGAMNPTLPPWDLLVVDLDDGGLALVLRFHHVLGDGVFGRALVMSLFDTCDADASSGSAPAPGAGPDRSPRHRAALAVAVLRRSRGSETSVPQLWQRFQSVPLRRRVRRVVARNLRPGRHLLARVRAGDGSDVAGIAARRMRMDLQAARRFCRASGGTLGDLMAALAVAALTVATPQRSAIGVLVPLSDRARGADPTGNAVKVARVALPAGSDLALLTASAAGQLLRARRSGLFPAVEPHSCQAYVSYLPGPPRRPTVLGRPVTSLLAWPAMDVGQDCAILASSWAGNLELALTFGGHLSTGTVATVIDTLTDLIGQQLEVAA